MACLNSCLCDSMCTRGVRGMSGGSGRAGGAAAARWAPAHKPVGRVAGVAGSRGHPRAPATRLCSVHGARRPGAVRDYGAPYAGAAALCVCIQGTCVVCVGGGAGAGCWCQAAPWACGKGVGAHLLGGNRIAERSAVSSSARLRGAGGGRRVRVRRERWRLATWADRALLLGSVRCFFACAPRHVGSRPPRRQLPAAHVAPAAKDPTLLSPFQHLLLVRALRPSRTHAAVAALIAGQPEFASANRVAATAGGACVFMFVLVCCAHCSLARCLCV
jgi:hypothetical protein